MELFDTKNRSEGRSVRRRDHFCAAIVLGAILCFPADGWGQAALFSSRGPEDVAPTRKLVITPATAPIPALRHRLTPPLRDLKPGNAALLYQRAHSPDWHGLLTRDEKKFNKFLEDVTRPLEKIQRDRIEPFFFRPMLREIDLAARRRHCDWEMIDRVREEGFGLLIPDVHTFRTYGALLSGRTRVHLLDRDFEKAVYSLQTHFTLGRHVSEAPILINVLVANAIASLALDDLEEMARLEGSPSMFWALADLPAPFLRVDLALEGERHILDGMFPGIREALNDRDRPPLTSEQLRKGFTDLMNLGQRHRGENPWQLAFFASRHYAPARDYLLAHGFEKEQIEAMPVLQVVAMHTVAVYDRYFDESAKWFRQPRWVARAAMRKADADLLKERFASDAAFLGMWITPALYSIHETLTRFERRLALLQTIEALRLYAGRNDGKLPRTLSDIGDLPLPLDPATGKAFEYELKDGVAYLVGPTPPDMSATETTNPRYEISVRKK